MAPVDFSRLRICFLAGTLARGGAEQQLYYILRALRNAGASLKLFCLTRGEWWEEKIRNLDVEVDWVGDHPGRPARLARIIREIRKERPHIFQAAHFYTNIYVALAARAVGAQEIGAIRSNLWSEVRHHGKLLGSLSLRLPRFTLANSSAALDAAIVSGVRSDRLALLRNVVDTERFRPTVRRNGPELRIASVGRLSFEKRHDRVLRLMARLKQAGASNVKLTIAGAGPLRDELQREAQRLDLLPETVEFAGALEDTAALYRRADLLVLSSDWEGTPNVVLEAMACGLPVIASRVGGVPELIRDGENGYLFDPSNEEAFFQEVMKVVSDADLRTRVGIRARGYIKDRHSFERLSGNLESVYRAALS